MLKLQKFIGISIIKPLLCRNFAQKPHKMSTKQVHKEIMKYVNPYAKINIQTDIQMRVRAADVNRYPNADVFIAELHGGHIKNCNILLDVKVSADEQQVDVQIKRQSEAHDFDCELLVPIKAALNIESKAFVNVEHMLGNELRIVADSIKTREIRCEQIALISQGGNINCNGMLLGKRTWLETKGDGRITLDKLQGDELHCQTQGGDIQTKCCYAEKSTFETQSGCLELMNVHKSSKVYVHDANGSLHMSGVHGNLQVQTKGHVLSLQLSELNGENLIVGENIENAIVNLSEKVEQSTEIDITAQNIKTEPSLGELSTQLSEDKKHFHHCPTNVLMDNASKLVVRNRQGTVQLGKLSWIEMMTANMER